MMIEEKKQGIELNLADKKFSVQEFTLEQDAYIVSLLNELNVNEIFKVFSQMLSKDFSEIEIDIQSLIQALVEKNLFAKFVASCLCEVDEIWDRKSVEKLTPYILKLKRSEYMAVISDFLSLNGQYFDKLTVFSDNQTKKENPNGN